MIYRPLCLLHKCACCTCQATKAYILGLLAAWNQTGAVHDATSAQQQAAAAADLMRMPDQVSVAALSARGVGGVFS